MVDLNLQLPMTDWLAVGSGFVILCAGVLAAWYALWRPDPAPDLREFMQHYRKARHEPSKK